MLRIEIMKIILKENIENLGKRGDIIEIAAGYGRNYLIPRKLALEVTPFNRKMVEVEQKALRKKLEKEVESFQGLIDKLNQAVLTFERKAGDKDVIFGSVSIADIKEGLDKLGFDIEKKRIGLDEPIKRLGNYTVPIKIFHDEQAEIKIEVKKEGGVEAKEEKEISNEGKNEKVTQKEGEKVRPEEEELVQREEEGKQVKKEKQQHDIKAEPAPEEGSEEANQGETEEPEKTE
jgi:large subunit ribosomal protein L9